MKKYLFWLSVLLGVFLSTPTWPQAPTEKMSVQDRLIKARAAKAEKKVNKTADEVATRSPTPAGQASPTKSLPAKTQKELPADYKAPVDKSQHGPNGEVIYTGARGARYYINKNGNKTYLSSNL